MLSHSLDLGIVIGGLAPGLVPASASVPRDLVANLAGIVLPLSLWLGHRFRCILSRNTAIVAAAFRSSPNF